MGIIEPPSILRPKIGHFQSISSTFVKNGYTDSKWPEYFCKPRVLQGSCSINISRQQMRQLKRLFKAKHKIPRKLKKALKQFKALSFGAPEVNSNSDGSVTALSRINVCLINQDYPKTKWIKKAVRIIRKEIEVTFIKIADKQKI